MRQPLAQAEPIHQRSFQRPQRSRVRAVEKQRHRQRRPHQSQRGKRLPQRPQPAFAAQRQREERVGGGKAQRRPARPVRPVFHHRPLQAEGGKGRAEQQRVVGQRHTHPVRRDTREDFVQRRIVGQRRRVVRLRIQQAAAGEKQGHQRVQQPVVQQKRFDRSKQRRRVIAQPPRRPNQKRARETGQIQRPPRLKPRHRRHARVQQREIGKQHHILPAAVRHQQRRGQTARQRGLRHRLRILFHRHRRRSRHQSRHRRKHHRRGQQRMQLQSRQRGEVHHRHAEAFEHQAVLAAAALQLPARKRGGQTRPRYRQITQPHRNPHPLRSVAQQKGQTEKQYHHARFQQRIAAHKPRRQRVFRIPRRRRRAGRA